MVLGKTQQTALVGDFVVILETVKSGIFELVYQLLRKYLEL